MVIRSGMQSDKMGRALQIIETNKKLATDHKYDFELYRSIVDMIDHTCHTYQDLSNLERLITDAHRSAFSDRQAAYNSLQKAEQLIESSLERRDSVYNKLVTTWEKTRLPKGMSTSDKQYFYKPDRARHFANRTPDMSYMIYDEQLLDMEGYLERLREYRKTFQMEF